jgi:hypothetical protein
VHAIAEEQARLAETDSKHPARFFGEHVEERQRAAVEWLCPQPLKVLVLRGIVIGGFRWIF